VEVKFHSVLRSQKQADLDAYQFTQEKSPGHPLNKMQHGAT